MYLPSDKRNRVFAVSARYGCDHFRENLIAQLRIAQVEHHLHALVNISMHPVGAAEIYFGFTAVAEYEDAAVLEKTADHAAHANPAADAAQSRAQRARSAHHQFDLHARLRSAIERLDDFFVEQRIYFREDKRRASCARVRRLRDRSA